MYLLSRAAFIWEYQRISVNNQRFRHFTRHLRLCREDPRRLTKTCNELRRLAKTCNKLRRPEMTCEDREYMEYMLRPVANVCERYNRHEPYELFRKEVLYIIIIKYL